MGLTLQQRQTQQMKLTPAQIQVIKMLEIPACDLLQRINEELQDNPALEEGISDVHGNEDDNGEGNDNESEYNNPLQTDDFNYDDYINDDDSADYDSGSVSSTIENTLSTSTTLFDYLKQQIYLTNMTKPERHIAKWVIGNIDDDGYLRRTTEQLVDDLAFQEGLSVPDAQMEAIVECIKQFDPAGVAAKDLQECLILQLKQRPQTPATQLATEILSHYFESYSKHQYAKMLESMDITEDELKDAINEILHLNQKPANAFIGNSIESRQMTIIPDFVVEDRDGDLVIMLNDGHVPPLHVSEDYQQMLQTYSGSDSKNKEDKEAVRFIRAKIDAADTFIQAIRQRNETLMRTMRAIVAAQRDFFLQGGDYSLKPLRMQDIADITGYDVSTISRVSNSKYVQTEYGIFPLKHFFNESTTNTDGEEVTTREVKKILAEIVDGEDKTEPKNDDQLVELLKERGYNIARRTIAKYRDLLGIPVARLRKKL